MPNSFWRKILWKAQRQNYYKGLSETEAWRSLTRLAGNNSSISGKPWIPRSPEKWQQWVQTVIVCVIVCRIVTHNSKRCWSTHKLQEDQDGKFTQGLCSPFICIKYIWALYKRCMASWWSPTFLKRGSVVRSNYQLFLAWPAKQLCY